MSKSRKTRQSFNPPRNNQLVLERSERRAIYQRRKKEKKVHLVKNKNKKKNRSLQARCNFLSNARWSKDVHEMIKNRDKIKPRWEMTRDDDHYVCPFRTSLASLVTSAYYSRTRDFFTQGSRVQTKRDDQWFRSRNSWTTEGGRRAI